MKAAYTNGRRLTVVVDSPVVRVHGWLAHKLALEAGIRPIYVLATWTFDEKRLGDFIAICERRNVVVEIEGRRGDQSQAETVSRRAAELSTAVDSSFDVDQSDIELPFDGGDAA